MKMEQLSMCKAQIINEGLNNLQNEISLGSEGLNIDMHGEIISSWCGKSFETSTNKGIELPNRTL